MGRHEFDNEMAAYSTGVLLYDDINSPFKERTNAMKLNDDDTSFAMHLRLAPSVSGGGKVSSEDFNHPGKEKADHLISVWVMDDREPRLFSPTVHAAAIRVRRMVISVALTVRKRLSSRKVRSSNDVCEVTSGYSRSQVLLQITKIGRISLQTTSTQNPAYCIAMFEIVLREA